MRYNFIPNRVKLRHAVIGDLSESSKKKYGDEKGAEHLTPLDLPLCDVLIMDIEGTETHVLEEMEITPRELVIESHGCLGSTTDQVKSLMESRGYNTKIIDVVNKQKDIFILKGIKERC